MIFSSTSRYVMKFYINFEVFFSELKFRINRDKNNRFNLFTYLTFSVIAELKLNRPLAPYYEVSTIMSYAFV